MTNLPSSTGAGDLDNLSVTRAEFRQEIGVLLEYIAQALGNVTGDYTNETVNPLTPILQGAPTIEVGADPASTDESLRIPSTQWVKRNGRFVGSSAPANPTDGTLWVDTTNSPYVLKVYNDGGSSWDVLSGIAKGTKAIFVQSTAPAGWTKDTSHDNKALRVVSGNVSTGGSLDFTSAFASNVSISGTIGSTTLTTEQMPSHTHGLTLDDTELKGQFTPGTHVPFHNIPVADRGVFSDGGNVGSPETGDSRNGRRIDFDGSHGHTGTAQATGGGQGHTHTFAGGNIALDVKYVDVIICTRD